ncbi:MAG: hypothetical protein ABR981_02385 [Candidatus Micrarchaeaceae archaeon]|jgi:hypothetical protein
MIYQARVNRKLRNIKVYAIKNKIGRKDNFMTKLFMRLFVRQKKTAEQQTAIERLR